MLFKSKVKYIQTLGQKKFRDEEQVFLAEGPKIVSELLSLSPDRIVDIYAEAEWVQQNKEYLKAVRCTEITEQELEKISQLKTPNKVLAIVKQYNCELASSYETVVLALNSIQDPGNLGTIIRIADWFGVTQIVCSNDTADMYNPKVIQSTMGSIARVKICYTDLQQWLTQQGDNKIYATVLEGHDVSRFGKIKKGVVLIGNESKGINPEMLALATDRITIPKKGSAESLNAGVATGIVLSHLI